MNEQQTSLAKQPKENLLFGIIGAFLFSLVGGVLYYILYQIGFFASISGVVGVVCAIKGYSFFSGRECKRGVIVSVITTIVVIILAWYLCLSYDVYVAYQEWFAAGEVDFTLTFFESVHYAWLFIPDAPGYLIDLALSLVFAGLGCWGYVSSLLKRQKAEAAFAAQQAETQAKLDAQTAQEQAAHEAQQADATSTEYDTPTEGNPTDSE